MKKLTIGISRTAAMEMGLVETKAVLKRRISNDIGDQTITLRLAESSGIEVGANDKYREIELKTIHPTNPSGNLFMQGRAECTGTHDTSGVTLLFKSKFGNDVAFHEHKVIASLNKIDGNVTVNMIFPNSKNYLLEGKLTASNVLGELRHGLLATLKVNGKLERSVRATIYPVINTLQLESIQFDHLGKYVKVGI